MGGPRKSYLLNTLSELRPIEIVYQLEVEYHQCGSDECSDAFVGILFNAALLDDIAQEHLSKQQIEFIRRKQARVESLFQSEVTQRINNNEPDRAVALLNRDSGCESARGDDACISHSRHWLCSD